MNELEARVQAIGRTLYDLAKREHAQLTTWNRWTKQVLAWCLADPALKNRVLRFIDCLPSLRTPSAVVQHVREYFPTVGVRLPKALRLGVSLSRGGLLTAPAVAAVVHQIVEQVARQFIAGARPEDALAVIQRLAPRGVLVSCDLLGEQVTSEAEADEYARRYRTFIAAIGRGCHLSIKPSSLSSRFDPLDFDGSLERAAARLRPIAELAVQTGAALTLDMEQYEYRDLTLALAKRLLEEPGLGERVQLGVVIQAYLRDAEAVTEELIAWLHAHHRQLAVRLVKGAYWDYEIARATQLGWPIPVYLDKRQTDQTFERVTVRLLSARDAARTEIASHNVRSISHAMAQMELLEIPKEQVEFQLLYGMGDVIQAAVSRLGYPVRIYTPVGELIPGMAYLVRRILENTANESFLRQDLWEHESIEQLLSEPVPAHAVGGTGPGGP